MKLYQNMDPFMRAVRQFEERVIEKGHTSLMKEAHKFAEKLCTSLSLEYPQPSCRSVSDPEMEMKGPKVTTSQESRYGEAEGEKVNEEKWHRQFLKAR